MSDPSDERAKLIASTYQDGLKEIRNAISSGEINVAEGYGHERALRERLHLPFPKIPIDLGELAAIEVVGAAREELKVVATPPSPIPHFVAPPTASAPAAPPHGTKTTVWTPTKDNNTTIWCLGLIVVMVVIAIIVSNLAGSESPKTGPTSNSGKFVASVGSDVTNFSVKAANVFTEAGKVLTGNGDPYKTDLDAQYLHDQARVFRTEVAHAPHGRGSEEVALSAAINDMMNAAGTIVPWAGDPMASTSAEWQAQAQTAIGEWNAAVIHIWSAAQAGTAPTIAAS